MEEETGPPMMVCSTLHPSNVIPTVDLLAKRLPLADSLLTSAMTSLEASSSSPRQVSRQVDKACASTHCLYSFPLCRLLSRAESGGEAMG